MNLNTISVDVEEYFHATNLERVAPPNKWHSLPHRVQASTERLLEIFQACNTKGTFFILGYSARRYPELVRAISRAGHEVSSHGYSHRLAYEQTPKVFFRDIYRTKHLLEDLIGNPVMGYRAPSFAIRDQNEWAYDCLVRAGYAYDSSLYPVWHPRYANQKKDPQPVMLARESGKLMLFPLAAYCLNALGKEWRLPAAGGAYWRLLPQTYNSWTLKQIQKEGRGIHCYLHPWEVDSEQPYFAELPWITRCRHYGGIKEFATRIEFFLRSFQFSTFRDVIPNVFGEEGLALLRRQVTSPSTSVCEALHT